LGTLQAPPIREKPGLLFPELAGGSDKSRSCIPCGVCSGSWPINTDPKAPIFDIGNYEMFADALKTTGLDSRLAVRDLRELVAEAVGLAAQAAGSHWHSHALPESHGRRRPAGCG